MLLHCDCWFRRNVGGCVNTPVLPQQHPRWFLHLHSPQIQLGQLCSLFRARGHTLPAKMLQNLSITLCCLICVSMIGTVLQTVLCLG